MVLGTWRKQEQGFYEKVIWPPMALRIRRLKRSALQNGGLDVPVLLQCRTLQETNPKGHWGSKLLFHKIRVFASSLYPVLVYPVLRSLDKGLETHVPCVVRLDTKTQTHKHSIRPADVRPRRSSLPLLGSAPGRCRPGPSACGWHPPPYLIDGAFAGHVQWEKGWWWRCRVGNQGGRGPAALLRRG
jgi:hypothetical protein